MGLNPTYILELITFYLTLVGLYFAYFQWFKTNRERKFHLLKVLKVQLDCLGPWVGSTGNGYGDTLTEEQLFDNSDPTKIIYTTGSIPLINSILLEQMSEVPSYIIGEISQLYYDFKKIESIQDYRNLLTSSNLKISNQVLEKLTNARLTSKSFKNYFLALSATEQSLVSILISYGKAVHCDIIGNKEKNARQHWEKAQEWIDSELHNYQKPQYLFTIISFILSYILLSITNLVLNLSNIWILELIICVFISLTVSILSKAIIVSNLPE